MIKDFFHLVVVMSIILIIGCVNSTGDLYERSIENREKPMTKYFNDFEEEELNRIFPNSYDSPYKQDLKKLVPIRLLTLGLLDVLEEELLTDFSDALSREIEEYVKNFKEEFILQNLLTPFTYATFKNRKTIVPDRSLKPLYDILSEIAGAEQVVFAPAAFIIVFHYPKDLRTINTQNHGWFDYVGVFPEDQINESWAPHSILRVVERNNSCEDNTITADCGFLIIIQPSSAVCTTVQSPRLIWLYCKCKWDFETKSWSIEKAKELSRGEQFLTY